MIKIASKSTDRFAARRDKARHAMRKAGADALLVTCESNVTYLTGFTGDSSHLLLGDRYDVLLTDSRYETQLADECPGLDLAVRTSRTTMHELTANIVGRRVARRLAIESASMTVEEWNKLAEALPKIELLPTSELVETLRMVKDKLEIEEIRQAIWIAERAFGVLRATLSPDRTERDVANALGFEMKRLGARGVAFPPIVAVGPNAALPHAQPGDRRIGEAPIVLVDWGARARLYRSDLTRVLVTGTIPPKLRKIFGVTLAAQRAAIAAIRPNVPVADVDTAARSVIEKAGFGKYFGHGTGHGIGIDIHEGPRLAKTSEQTLKPGMVITVEPGIYLPQLGGVRIEDDVLVTNGGHEVLTHVPKELEESIVSL